MMQRRTRDNQERHDWTVETVAWLAALVEARTSGKREKCARAREELRRLGVHVRFAREV